MKKIIVHGVHRSGTSLCSNLFAKSGLWFAEKEFQMPAQEDNPEGFWERTDVTNLNDEILTSQGLTWFTLLSRLKEDQLNDLSSVFEKKIETVSQRLESNGNWFLKDPRLSITWPLWKKHLEVTDHVLIHRHPLSVAKSLYKRNNVPINVGLLFWYHQMRMIAASLVEENNVHHIELLSEGQRTHDLTVLLNEILYTETGELCLDDDSVEEIIKPDLIHNKVQVIDAGECEFSSTIEQAWELSRNGDFTELLKLPELTEITLKLSDCSSAYSDLINKKSRVKELEEILSQRSFDQTQQIIDKLISIETELEFVRARNMEEDAQSNNANMPLENSIQIETSSAEINSLLNEEIVEHKDKLIEIARNIQKYKNSPLGIFSILSAKLKLASIQPLQAAMDIAMYGFSQNELSGLKELDSTRMLLIKTIIKEPKVFLRKFTIRRFVSGMKILMGKNVQNSSAHQALKRYETMELSDVISLDIFPVEESIEGSVGLEFPEINSPTVSIVIPVYNEYETTLSCLQSIKKYTNFDEIPYEIIIADDASNDETNEIENNIGGLNVVRSDGNLGFLKNCNNAIKHVRGEYILLLNNDTNVQKDWLSELLTVLKSDSSIGVAGPKFVYPDGRLQEAGGIIFSDANGWNYGRFDSPVLPEYNFFRDVDYVSGACLLFSTSHWLRIGGFDECFAPAYYEDTDFCFQTRELGLRVVYIPSSVVVHFEGVSHGQDETTGIKQYQVENKAKFLKKWSDVLTEDHHADSTSLFKARSHGKTQKVLVFIDHYVPFYDKDAGSKVAQRYIELMIQEGIRVIFIGDNFYPHEPYTKELQALGVEVLYGEYYKNNWIDWLKENCQFIDSIYLNRPHIANQYIDKILRLDNVPYLAYHGADLHYLRVDRETKLGINDSKLSSAEWKEIEYSIMRKCDVTFWLSDLEISLVKQEDPEINVQYKPMWWTGDAQRNAPKLIDNKNLLFVGSFGHPPNLDGLIWFLDNVFPQIVEGDADVKLIIIGSNCPKEIYDLESENITVLGYVSERELASAYERARLSVVPLRYGAGVKGKVIESMQFGVPVLTTDIGAEGLPGDVSSYLTIANTIEEFKESLTNLIRDDSLILDVAAKAEVILQNEFSRKTAVEAIGKMFRP